MCKRRRLTLPATRPATRPATLPATLHALLHITDLREALLAFCFHDQRALMMTCAIREMSNTNEMSTERIDVKTPAACDAIIIGYIKAARARLSMICCTDTPYFRWVMGLGWASSAMVVEETTGVWRWDPMKLVDLCRHGKTAMLEWVCFQHSGLLLVPLRHEIRVAAVKQNNLDALKIACSSRGQMYWARQPRSSELVVIARQKGACEGILNYLKSRGVNIPSA